MLKNCHLNCDVMDDCDVLIRPVKGTGQIQVHFGHHDMSVVLFMTHAKAMQVAALLSEAASEQPVG